MDDPGPSKESPSIATSSEVTKIRDLINEIDEHRDEGPAERMPTHRWKMRGILRKMQDCLASFTTATSSCHMDGSMKSSIEGLSDDIDKLLTHPKKTKALRDRKHHGDCDPYFYRYEHYDLSPACLRTCKALYQEGLPFLYGENTIGLIQDCCQKLDLDCPLLWQLGPNTHLVKHVYLDVDTESSEKLGAFHALAEYLFENDQQFKSLTLSLDPGGYLYSAIIPDALIQVFQYKVTGNVQLRVKEEALVDLEDQGWSLVGWDEYFNVHYDARPIVGDRDDFNDSSYTYYNLKPGIKKLTA
ncbi:uncharacterized protein KY384_007511 [Bacidia gigantensis]|uniref:uncharacterized protein n=1 Tax=Bacidia gigantensis TaxID=2732470 RepID=UPI001D05359B|nr:uncharacterized protein KY384_007511 [Bacidia gigantensis]KAG8527359.1 hypothetical protein KY384_007511 [Bacidia gigantensis]